MSNALKTSYSLSIGLIIFGVVGILSWGDEPKYLGYLFSSYDAFHLSGKEFGIILVTSGSSLFLVNILITPFSIRKQKKKESKLKTLLIIFLMMLISFSYEESSLSYSNDNEYMKVQLTIMRARISTTKEDGSKWEFFKDPPDPYVKIKINNRTVGRTSTKQNTYHPVWAYKTNPFTMTEEDTCLLELFDNDNTNQDDYIEGFILSDASVGTQVLTGDNATLEIKIVSKR